MKLLLQLIVYGLFINNVFGLLSNVNRLKRHVWRGNPISQSYDPPQHAGIKTSRGSHPASLHHPYQSNEIKCNSNEVGLKPHPVNCQMYIACFNGKAKVDTCSDGFLFNPDTMECDFASSVDCSTSSTHSAGQYDASLDSFESTDVTDTDKEVINGFHCTEEGLFEHPNDCAKFIQCAHSGLYIQSCGTGTLFNPSLKICDWPKNVRCNKILNSNIKACESRGRYDDLEIDVRMSDTDLNTRSTNNAQQDCNHNNAEVQSNQRHNHNSVQTATHQSHGTIDFSRSFQPQQHNPAESQSRSIQSESNIRGTNNGIVTSGRPIQPQRTLQPPFEDHSSQQHNIYPVESQRRSFQSESNTRGSNIGIVTSGQPIQPQRTLQPPFDDHSSQQHNIYPAESQSRSFQSESNTRESNNGIVTSGQPIQPQRTLQPPFDDHSSQQHNIYPAESQSRSFQSESNTRGSNIGIVTSGQPIQPQRTLQPPFDDHSSQQHNIYPAESQSRSFQSESNTRESNNGRFTSGQPIQPQRTLQPPFDDHSSQQHNIYPAESQSRSFQSESNIRGTNNGIVTSGRPIQPQRTLQPPFEDHSSQQHNIYPVESQRRSFQSESNTRGSNIGIVTSGQPIQPQRTLQPPFDDHSSQQHNIYSAESQSRSFQSESNTRESNNGRVTSGQPIQPQRTLQPPFDDDSSQQHNINPAESQSRSFQSESNIRGTNNGIVTSGQPIQPQRTLQPPFDDHSSQQHNIYPAESQSRSFQSESNKNVASGLPIQPQRTLQPPVDDYPSQQSRSFQSESNIRGNSIKTSVLPLANPQTQHNGNLVHSSPSYSKTRVYSAQPDYREDDGIPPTKQTESFHQSRPSSTFANSQNDYQREQLIQQSASNKNENFKDTMDLLDTYTHINSQNKGRESKENIMTVSNNDHDVPIYNRPHYPRNLPFATKITDDLQTEQSENISHLSEALKLLLSPYGKNVPLQTEDVAPMSKVLNIAENGAKDGSTSTVHDNSKIIEENSFNGDESTRFTHTLNYNIRQNTKIDNLPARTNALLEDEQENKYFNRLNRPMYHKEEIEIFCTNGFDCGNGLCLSSEKICDGRDNCGNRMDEKNCKHVGYDIRLSSESDRRNMGRIEVKVFNKWGHICDDKFRLNEANVLCREVGFPLGAVEVKANSYLPNVNMSIDESPMFTMDELRCTGNESSLKDCDFNGWGVHNCDSEGVVGVVCKLPDMKCQLNYWLCDQSEECIPTAFLCDAVNDCSDGSDESATHCNSSIQYRLGNTKSNQREGRVEVRYRGIWGTVCDDDFGENEAKVFCRSMGYDGAAAVIKEFVEPGDGLIWLDQVSCQGNESSLEHCAHFEWGENNCNHTEDVSVRCFEREETHQKLIVRERKGGFGQLNEIHRRSKSEQEQCGQILVSDDLEDYDDQPVFKVIEGSKAKRGHHPWQATIRVRGRNGKSSHWCGAVLISKTHLLTAAHCLIGFTKNAYFIRLGDHHSEVVEDTEAEVFIEDWHIHEKFRRGHLMNNDIALIKLKSTVKFTDYIQPICLPPDGTEYTAGKNCSISGWGSIQYGKSTPSLELRSAYIPIMSEEICKQTNNYGSSIQSGMFCAGKPEEMIDACDGDSGGPFVCSDNGVNGYHLLYGIISWGQRCGDKQKPGVYTKVVEYLPWIQEKMML